jgi:hypothetical protein
VTSLCATPFDLMELDGTTSVACRSKRMVPPPRSPDISGAVDGVGPVLYIRSAPVVATILIEIPAPPFAAFLALAFSPFIVAGWGGPMTLPTLLSAIVEALRSAGATEEMIAAAVKASGELQTPHPGRRPRKHASEGERAREYRKRKSDETGFVTPVTPACDETSFVTPAVRV